MLPLLITSPFFETRTHPVTGDEPHLLRAMPVMAASVRHKGRSLAEIAKTELGKSASLVSSLAILVIVVIALGGLAFVVVKALGGEDAKLPAGTIVVAPDDEKVGFVGSPDG